MAPDSFGRRILAWLQSRAHGDRRRLTLTITASDAERPTQVEIPRWTLRAAVAIGIGALVLLLGGGMFGVWLIRQAVQVQDLRDENARLREDSARLEALEREVRQIDEIRSQLYALAGVPDDAMRASWADEARGEPSDSSGLMILSESAIDTPLRHLPFRGPVSRGFARDPKRRPDHGGIDIAGPEGASIEAAGDGVVAFAGWDETFGNLLVLEHDGGWQTRYGHNLHLFVARGDSVRAGQAIALLGSTGKSSAPHLHFEAVRGGKAVDPADYFLPYRIEEGDRTKTVR